MRGVDRGHAGKAISLRFERLRHNVSLIFLRHVDHDVQHGDDEIRTLTRISCGIARLSDFFQSRGIAPFGNVGLHQFRHLPFWGLKQFLFHIREHYTPIFDTPSL